MSNFVQRKLCRESLDAFALKYSGEHSRKVPYTTADGKTISVVPFNIITQEGISEYRYLVGQTFPYQDRKEGNYPITDLAFTKTKDGKKVPWTRNSKDITSLIALGTACGELVLRKGKNNQLEFTVVDSIKAVTHDEGIEHE